MKRLAILVTLLGLVGLLAACQSTPEGNDEGNSSASSASSSGNLEPSKPKVEVAIEDPANDYYELRYDGRLYVVGSAESAKAFRAAPHLPYTKTHIGGGPARETLVFEIDPKSDDLYDRLHDHYMHIARTRVEDPASSYWEFLANGRIYVIGNAASADSFTESPHLPYTKTYIGAGPSGETVIVEIDQDDAALVDRLSAAFEQRHGVSL